MAKKNRIPSEESVPHQDRYPVEGAANMYLPINIIPREDINSNTVFPLPKLKTIEECRQTGEFVSFSHTNGKR